MGIPMAREGSIVHEGWTRQHKQSQDQYQESRSSLLMDMGNVNEGNSGGNERKEEDGALPLIAPSLLPLEGSNHGPDPALARQGRWWEKWIYAPGVATQQQQHQPKNINMPRDSQIEDLEEPDQPQSSQQQPQPTTPQRQQQQQQRTLPTAATIYAPGRRLEGDSATKVQIPLANTLQNNKGGPGFGGIDSSHHDLVSLQRTKHQSIARLAISREWEFRVAHGLNHRPSREQVPNQHRQQHHNPAMLDGRMYMSAKESYPMMVFSLLRYEPKKEEALRRRQKLEERGGGGTQFFIMPSRDWRGISFRALLPITTHEELSKTANRDGLDDGDGTIERTEPGLMTGKGRLLFDRFAAKKLGSKENFVEAEAKEGEIQTSDRNLREASSGNGGEEIDIDMNSDNEDEDGFGDDTYIAGLLDDPKMVQGRHRNVMIGDRGTGPIVSSTIQFVKPKLLKADLNKQFRERFDGYEPPISQRKFIGAKVVDGIYTLMDPTQEKDDDGSNSKKNEDDEDDATDFNTVGTSGTPTTGATNVSVGTKSSNPRAYRRRQGSTSSISLSTVGGGGSIDGGTGEGTETIRMPPSLTLSKIRSLKQQALAAAVRAKLEISTVALAIVYFERLCLDCRVDKSNRRLSFSACLLLAIKINEPHVGVIATKAVVNPTSSKKSKATQRIQSLIRTSKKSSTMFASLLEFFTQEWNISLKHLFAAEWGVFAALQFRLKAKPSDVAFHFRRLMKTLGYDPRRYLGSQAYGNWQGALAEEGFRRQEWEARIELRRQRKENKKLKQLRREIEAADRNRDGISDGGSLGDKHDQDDSHIQTGGTLEEQIEIPSPMQTNTIRRRLGLGAWMIRRGSGDAAQASDRYPTRSRESGDAAPSVIKNNTTPVAVVAMPRQRQRQQLLRPLSHSRSMTSLAGKEREMSERNGFIDNNSRSKKLQIHLDDLEKGNAARGRRRGRSFDRDEDIII
mmetsp:Transcript_20087/g.47121  ORF Transcript_20087/g.47121 Transcript_20087/m.47121 type:complete len:964 (+) Transcript_20087:1-2892(+)